MNTLEIKQLSEDVVTRLMEALERGESDTPFPRTCVVRTRPFSMPLRNVRGLLWHSLNNSVTRCARINGCERRH
jgi:hypothetical protein